VYDISFLFIKKGGGGGVCKQRKKSLGKVALGDGRGTDIKYEMCNHKIIHILQRTGSYVSCTVVSGFCQCE